MELTAAFSGIQQARTRDQINVAVAKKVMDTQKQAGANVLAMLSKATIAPGDDYVASATGLGGAIDTFG